MRLIANRQLVGDYGSVVAGEEFECSDHVAGKLLRNGLARRADPPQIVYDTKVIVPQAPAVGAGPFCHLHLPDPEPEAMVATSDSLLPPADVSQQGTVNPRGRRGRKGSGSGNGIHTADSGPGEP